MQIIPLTSDPIQKQTVTLDGVSYEMLVKFNDASQVWTMDLSLASDGTPLAYGIPMVLGADLLAAYGLGFGKLFMIDNDGTSTDAGPDDLGDRVQMVFATNAEAAALA